MKILLLLSSFCLLGHLPGTTVLGQRRAETRRPTRIAQQRDKPPTATQGSTPPLPSLSEIRNDPDVQEADIAIIANVTAKELLFEVVPNPVVKFPGKPARENLWEAKRFNLPERIEPGVTYRNIGIQLKITSRFADIERIVAEALGEIPIDDTPVGETQSAPSGPITGPSGKTDEANLVEAPADSKKANGRVLKKGN